MNTEIQSVEPKKKSARDFHTTGATTYTFKGPKWHFETKLADGKLHTYITKIRGGLPVADRIAKLVDKDVTRNGRLGGQRANIQRLVEAANS